ncbi:MAG: phage tail tube protein [SAR324 cluster bacterium]|jgi:hypothetical protein|nr:phage tail tube protein [SAR324 cluster bacterium]
MALDGQALSPREYLLAFKPETTQGTKNVGTMNLINIDSIPSPSLNLTQVVDPRNGAGRTAKTVDAFTSEKGTRKEISFSGVADNTTLPILLQAITTTAVSSSPASYDIAYNYTPPEVEIGIGSISDNLHTFTVAVSNPETGNDHSTVFPGCVLTSLSLSGSISAQSGRVMVSGTFATGMVADYGHARPTSTVAYSSTNYSINQFTTTTTVAGIANCVISDWTLNIENPSEMAGFQGSNGEPQAIVRAVPEISVSCDVTVKADDNTSGLHAQHVAGAIDEAVELSNNASWASATTFGMKMANGVITSVDFNESNAMYYNVSIKALALAGSGDLIQIIA